MRRWWDNLEPLAAFMIFLIGICVVIMLVVGAAMLIWPSTYDQDEARCQDAGGTYIYTKYDGYICADILYKE